MLYPFYKIFKDTKDKCDFHRFVPNNNNRSPRRVSFFFFLLLPSFFFLKNIFEIFVQKRIDNIIAPYIIYTFLYIFWAFWFSVLENSYCGEYSDPFLQSFVQFAVVAEKNISAW